MGASKGLQDLLGLLRLACEKFKGEGCKTTESIKKKERLAHQLANICEEVAGCLVTEPESMEIMVVEITKAIVILGFTPLTNNEDEEAMTRISNMLGEIVNEVKPFMSSRSR